MTIHSCHALKVNFELNLVKCVVNSHYDELWGLSVGGGERESSSFLTCGNDRTLACWDTLSHTLVWSTLLDEPLRCVDMHPSLEVAALGLATKNKWLVWDLRTRRTLFSQVEGGASGSNPAAIAAEHVEVIRFAPDGRQLAIGSRDNYIYVYSVSECGLKYARIGRCSGHSSFITHLDWSRDSLFLMSNSGDYEVLAFDFLKVKRSL